MQYSNFYLMHCIVPGLRLCTTTVTSHMFIIASLEKHPNNCWATYYDVPTHILAAHTCHTLPGSFDHTRTLCTRLTVRARSHCQYRASQVQWLPIESKGWSWYLHPLLGMWSHGVPLWIAVPPHILPWCSHLLHYLSNMSSPLPWAKWLSGMSIWLVFGRSWGQIPSWSWNFSLFVGIMDYHKPILLYLNSKEQQYVRMLKDLFGLLKPKRPSDLQSAIVY